MKKRTDASHRKLFLGRIAKYADVILQDADDGFSPADCVDDILNKAPDNDAHASWIVAAALPAKPSAADCWPRSKPGTGLRWRGWCCLRRRFRSLCVTKANEQTTATTGPLLRRGRLRDGIPPCRFRRGWRGHSTAAELPV